MRGNDVRTVVELRRGVDVTAHRRAVWLRIGTVAAVASGALLGAATPAFAAAKVDISVSPGTTNLTVGGSPQVIVITVRNSGDATAQNVRATIDVPLGTQQVTISNRPDECDQGSGNHLTCTIGDLNDGESKNLSLTVSPPGQSNIQPGQTVSDNGTITPNSGQSETFRINLKNSQAAPPQAAPVTEVSGRVVDSASGQSLASATVVIQDGANKQAQTGTDASGKFKFTSLNGKPITAGTITFSASKDGYDNPQPQSRQAGGGQKLTGLQINMKLSNASASAPAAPESAAGDAPTSAPAGAGDIANQGNKAANSSPFSLVFIVLGGLLVLLGIGAIVVLLRRRGDDDDDDDDLDGDPQGPPPGGGYRPMADPTMVGTSMGAPAMAGRSNANDATILTPPVDPYGAPPDPYGAPPNTRNAGYDNPTTVGGYTNTAGFAAGGGPAGYGPDGPGSYGADGPGAYGAGGRDSHGASGASGQPGYGAGGPGAGYGAGGRDGYGAGGQGSYGAGAAGSYEAEGPGGYGAGRPGGHSADGYGAGAAGGHGAGAPSGYGANGAAGAGRPRTGDPGAAGSGAYGSSSGYGDRGGYGGADQGERGGYGAGGQGGPSDRGSSGASGYGSSQEPGYGSSHDPGYGDRTGYSSSDRGGYGDDRSRGYEQGGYGAGGQRSQGDRGGYGSPEPGSSGYGDRGGYGPAAGSGYDNYGQSPERRGDYGQPGYDRPGRSARDGEPGRGGDRRPLDWLDD
jgi:hypothetical protein